MTAALAREAVDHRADGRLKKRRRVVDREPAAGAAAGRVDVDGDGRFLVVLLQQQEVALHAAGELVAHRLEDEDGPRLEHPLHQAAVAAVVFSLSSSSRRSLGSLQHGVPDGPRLYPLPENRRALCGSREPDYGRHALGFAPEHARELTRELRQAVVAHDVRRAGHVDLPDPRSRWSPGPSFRSLNERASSRLMGFIVQQRAIRVE